MDPDVVRESQALTPAGPLTAAEAGPLREALLARLAGGASEILLDLSAVERLDTPGAQVLMAARQSGRVRFQGLPPAVSRALSDLGWSGLPGDGGEVGP